MHKQEYPCCTTVGALKVLSLSALAGLDLIDGPTGVFGDQGFRIFGGFLQGGQGGFISHISQRDTDVAQQAFSFCAQDWRACEADFEGGIVQGKQFQQVRSLQFPARMLFHQISFAGEFVPRARGEAIITTVNAVADGGAEFDGDGALELDGEVGNAAAGIKLEWRGDGSGGARGDTAGAGAATIFFGCVGGKFQRGDDFRKENPVAKTAADEVGVFADKAESSALGEVAFKKRAGVDVPERAVGFAAKSVEQFGELLQAAGEDVVVILKSSVAGNNSLSRVLSFGSRVVV